MKKLSFFVLALLLILIFLFSSCTLHQLIRGEPIDEEVAKLIQNLPPAELYPDAHILVILKEEIDEAFEDGRSINTLHMVFQVRRERGKDYADIEIGHNFYKFE